MPVQPSDNDPIARAQRPTDVAGGPVAGSSLPPEDPHLESPLGATRQSRVKAAKAKITKLADQASAGVDQASAAASRLNSRAAAAYDRARARARDVQERVDPLVHERPYVAIGIAACVGLFLGMLLGRGPKVIYVRPRD